MIVINILVDGVIKPYSVYDTNNKLTQTITKGLKIPTGNYNDVLLNFYFISPKPKEGLYLFGIFKSPTSKKIEMEISNFEYEGETFENSCFIPHEVLDAEGKVELGVYGYKMNGEELEKRISLIPIEFTVVKGSYDEEVGESVLPTPTTFDIYFDKVAEANKQMQENLDTFNKSIENKFIETNDLLNEKILFHKKYEELYLTTEENQTVIPIEKYTNPSMVFVDINGLALNQTEFELDRENQTIILTNAIDVMGTEIHITQISIVSANESDYDLLKGVGISSVKQTTTSTEDGGTNIITVTQTDGTNSTFSVKNGSKGSDGKDGVGVPTCGTIGQMLVKKSGTDYDMEWKDSNVKNTTEIEDKENNTYSANIIDNELNKKQNTLTAGENVTIENDTIGVNTNNILSNTLISRGDIPSTDANDIITPGCYRTVPFTANGPVESGWGGFLIVFRPYDINLNNSVIYCQLFVDGNGGTIYIRTNWYGTWYDWKSLL